MCKSHNTVKAMWGLKAFDIPNASSFVTIIHLSFLRAFWGYGKTKVSGFDML